MMEVKRLVPALRFKEFVGDIKETFFGKHYTFHTTNSLSRDKLNYDNGEVRNIHYGDIHTKFQTHFHLTKEYVPFINEDVDLAKIKEESYCKIGDVVIADASEDYADIGKSIELIDINSEKLLAGLHTFLARPSSENMAVGYISYLLKSWKLRKQIMTIAQGTKVLSLSTGRVSKLKLNLPSLPEQQKIASFLSAVDEKIQQLTKKKELLEHYKKGVMQQLFSGKLRFKDVDGKDFPEWEEKRLGDVATFLDGRRKPIKSGDRSKMQGEYPYYGASGIIDYVDNYIFDEEIILLGEDGENIISRNLPLAFRVSGKCWVNNHAHVIKPNDNTDIDFLTFSLERINYEPYNTGTAQPKLNQAVCRNLLLDLPSLPEQQKIATYLSRIDSKIESVNQQITQTQTFKKGLLQQLFV